MKINFHCLVLSAALLVGLLWPSVGFSAEKKKPVPPPAAISKLGWLGGNWRMEKDSRVIDVQWMAPAGGVMLGMSRTLLKGRETEHEFVQIREGPGGDLFFVAQATGRKEAAFQLTLLTANTVVFENQLQDFPQKVSYILQPDGSLLAVMEGPGPDGEAKRIEYTCQRVPR